MNCVPETHQTLQAARKAAFHLCAQARTEGLRPVLLVDTSYRALVERRALAAAGAGFGVEVTTLAHWIASLWPLHGDVRTPISSAQRIAIAAQLVSKQNDLPATPGTVNLLARAAREALTLRTRPAQLTGNEILFVKLLDAYALLLQEQASCEYCEMIETLSTQSLAHTYMPIVFDVDPSAFCACEQIFLESLDAKHVIATLAVEPAAERSPELSRLLELLFRRTSSDMAVPATGSLICALAAGPSAQQQATYRCIEDAIATTTSADMANIKRTSETPQTSTRLEHPRICITSKNPERLFNFCAPLLEARGINARLSATTTFAQTDIGRAVLACLDLTSLDTPVQSSTYTHLNIADNSNPSSSASALETTILDKLEAADYSFNPFSGMRYTDAFQADQAHRGNRLLSAQAVLSGLTDHAADELKDVLKLFQQANFEDALDLLQNRIQESVAHPWYRAVQMRALAIARESLRAAHDICAPPKLVMQALANQPIDVSATLSDDDTAEGVLFTTMAEATTLDPCSMDAVVICNLDVDSYPVRVRHDAYTTLLQKWNAYVATSPLAAQHRMMFHILAAARQRVYLQRSLNDCEAAPQQPAVLFDEVMDCYRASLTDYQDIDDKLGIVGSLVPFALQTGEEDIIANATGKSSTPMQDLAWPPVGQIGTQAKKLLVLPRTYSNTTYEGADLSASQIESYLECPYQWFAKRRLRVEDFEEGFGSMERGTFVHNVLCAFYQAFQERVAPKVTQDNLEQAYTLFDQVFAEQVAHDREREPGRRYVPVSLWEEQLLADLQIQLRESIKNEVEFLPRFHPIAFEWDYGKEHPFAYAGCNLVGTIDRIDVDNTGNAVVIDYKTGNLGEYSLLQNANQQEPALPHKMQTLIYAQVVRQELGLNIVGALYYNPFKRMVRGAYDSRVLGPQDFFGFGSTIAACNHVPAMGIETFNELIDTCENLVATHIDQLFAGEIEPSPLSNKVCQFCPVGICEKRLDDGGAL